MPKNKQAALSMLVNRKKLNYSVTGNVQQVKSGCIATFEEYAIIYVPNAS